MGWETRKRGGRYYTRSRKVGGRVVREYIGGGPLGELAAQGDALLRAQRQVLAARLHDERAQLAARDALMRAYCQQVDAQVRAELRAAGYHQHARGEWRRERARTHGEDGEARGETHRYACHSGEGAHDDGAGRTDLDRRAARHAA